MAQRSLEVDREHDDVWRELQLLATWEGLGGLSDLSDGTWDDDGDLTSFRFALETPLGKIHDSAKVRADKPVLAATADAKGLKITVRLELAEGAEAGSTTIDFRIDAKSTSFMTKLLEGTLRATLEQGIDGERKKLASRLANDDV